jgi:hypothetical protein
VLRDLAGVGVDVLRLTLCQAAGDSQLDAQGVAIGDGR